MSVKQCRLFCSCGLGLHYLHRSVCQNTCGKYGIANIYIENNLFTLNILIRRRDKQRICVFYATVKSKYSIVSKIKRTRYAESFSDTQITSAWCVSDLFAFISVLQTEFCIFINSGRNSRLLLLQMDGKPV